MPGWLIHLAFAYLVSKLLKIRDISLVLIGAILPDVSRVLAVLNFFNLSAKTYYVYLSPLHSPFLVIILAIAMSLLFRKPLKSFLYLSLGFITHFFLDQLQSAYSTGKLLLYPFSYLAFSQLNLFWADSKYMILFMIISFIILIYAVFDKNKKPVKITTKRVFLVILLILFYLILPVLTFNTFMEKDPYIQQFERNNTELLIAYAVIKSEDPIILSEMDYEYQITNQINVKKGDWISAKAEFQNNKITIKEYYKHNRLLKEGASALALLALIIIIIKNPKRYKP